MTFRMKTMILSSVLVALALLFFSGTLFSEKNVQKSEAQKQVFPGFRSSDVEKILLSHSGKSIELFRDSGTVWKIRIGDATYPASKAKLDSLLQELSTLRTIRLTSKNQSNWKKFGVDPEAADSLAVMTDRGTEKYKVFVGLPSGGGMTTCVRFGSENSIYEVKNSLRSFIDEKETYWEDLRILPDDVKDSIVSRVSVKADLTLTENNEQKALNEEYTLIRESSGNTTAWKVSGKDMSAIQSEVSDLVRNIVTLEGTEFLNASEPVLEKPAAELLLETDSGKRFRFLFGTQNGDIFPVKLEGGIYTYKVSEWRVGKALRRLSALTEANK